MITFSGDCGVAIKGEARDKLELELIALLERRNIDVLEEARDRREFSYGGKISLQGQEMGVGISSRTFPGFGYWSLLIFIPKVPDGDSS